MGALSRLLGVGALLLCSVQGASAQLVRADSAFGAETIIQDSASGLAWLRLDITRGLSFNDVMAQTGEGGAFSGFRNATRLEVSQLVGNISTGFASSDYAITTDAGEVERAATFGSWFGGPLVGAPPGGGTNFLLGYAGGCSFSDGGVCYAIRDSGLYWRETAAGRSDTGLPMSTIAADAQHGTWLVTPVPEPSTYALMLAGLMALAFVGRRRKQPLVG